MAADAVKLVYKAWSNISYKLEVDTGMSRDEWEDLDEKERREIIAEYLWNDIDVWEE